jgi:hypothetical protein
MVEMVSKQTHGVEVLQVDQVVKVLDKPLE